MDDEQQANQKQRLEVMGQFAGGIAHDFNNILSIIEGYADILARRMRKGESCVEYADKIIETAQRGGAITRQLLSFSQFNITPGEVLDLSSVIADQDLLIKPLLGGNIACVFKLSQPSIYIEGAKEHISQIFLNLASNAHDAMPDGGVFTIEMLNLENMVCIVVSDTGEGITPDNLKHIFDPFFTTKSHGSGTGLGLSTVYGLIHQMGGKIDVTSDIGQGTVFEIHLPKTDLRPKITEISKKERTSVLAGRTILIAEDEPDLQIVLSEIMLGLDMKVLTANNGHHALLVQDDYDGVIDFLLTDVVMPEMDGGKLAELFGALRPETQVVFMSGYPSHGYGKGIFIPPNARLINKPVRRTCVAQVLQYTLT